MQAQNSRIAALEAELQQTRALLERANARLREQYAQSERQSLTVDALHKVASYAMSTVGEFGTGIVDNSVGLVAMPGLEAYTRARDA